MKKVLIILFFVVLAGYAGYCALAQYEFSQGQAAFEAKDWLTALEHFERVDGYKFVLPSHSSEISMLRDQSSLLIYIQAMREKKDYQSALDACNSFIALYPKAEAIPSVKELLPAIYMDWGIGLRDKSDFAGAIEKFETVIQTYAQASTSDPAQKATSETYRAWGDSLAKAEDYETAVEKYEVLSKKFSIQPAAQGVADVLSETYINWADQLRTRKQQELALEKYNFIIANFGDMPAATRASTVLAPTMLEWTTALHADQKFTEEIEILRKLIADYNDTPEAQQARQKIVAAYDSYGKQLINSESFILSMQTYDDAREFAQDENAKSVVDVGYNDAIQGLSADTGKDGVRIIDEAFETACAGKPALSPAVGISKTQGKGKVCGEYKPLFRLTAHTPGEFKFVLLVEFTRTANVGSCTYSGGFGDIRFMLIRQVNIYTATVYSTVTGKKINERTFRGSTPYCPETRTFTSETEYLTGTQADIGEISDWLQSIFKK